MADKLEIGMEAINKWLYYSWNYKVVPVTFTTPGGVSVTPYVPEFIKEINWRNHISHIIDKWREATATNDPDTYLPRFYARLDARNQKKLLEWVLINYQDEKKIK